MDSFDKVDRFLNSPAVERLLSDVRNTAAESRELVAEGSGVDALADYLQAHPAVQDAIVRGEVWVETAYPSPHLPGDGYLTPNQPEAPVPTGQETRVVDPKTGGAKGSKLARFDLVPPDVMVLLAEHYGRGARKYADRNWEKGYDWGLSYAALQRHLSAFWAGEDVDHDPSLYIEGEEETALHIVAALWHCVALAAFFTRAIGTDSRP